ncbi:MAG: hypothetical protein FRX48_00328 [Lasallia pustulata]|uniref:Uncharacterized protein n=1 Tax=Lasallia pustulata TaxID=136370 RepID=A0A5M8Q1L7_9LECA|nr:MAG: hypothetical protein FRX48_00328 [Lasallia pustulata]
MLDLFTRIEIKKIVVDVRADGPAASLAGWWSNSYLPKPETADFSTLKPANIDSTLSLLPAVSEAPTILKFVYLSSGQQHNPSTSHSSQTPADGTVLTTDCAQTKSLSDLLVPDFSRLTAHHAPHIAILKPSSITRPASRPSTPTSSAYPPPASTSAPTLPPAPPSTSPTSPPSPRPSPHQPPSRAHHHPPRKHISITARPPRRPLLGHPLRRPRR